MSKEAMKLALDEFKHIKQWCLRSIGIGLVNENVLTALEEALAKQEQGEPVAWLYHDAGSLEEMLEAERKCLNIHSVLLSIRRHEAYRNETPLYTTPQQRTWVGLTEEERDEIYLAVELGANGEELIEAKLKEKNT